jgi:hypothetical protein
MTPEEMEQAFRAWWAESYRVPANGQAVATAVAWGMHVQGLLGDAIKPRGLRQVQAVVSDDERFLFAVADDGTAWELTVRKGWQQIPPLPEP